MTMQRRDVLKLATQAATAVAAAAGVAHAQTTASPNSNTSIFAGTMAEMRFPEIAEAAKRGASIVWALGVIEEHGPHLPLGTDVYAPSAILRRAKALLLERQVETLILPPFYWGVNQVTGAFPGSVDIRPELMVEVIVDVCRSMKKDGFQRVFCLSGHGDASHNRAIFDGVTKGRVATEIDMSMLIPPIMLDRLQLDAKDPRVTRYEPEDEPQPQYADVHAGATETSVMLAVAPELVRSDIVAQLEPTRFDRADLAEWRKGQQVAAAKTPLGYLGDPASATVERGFRRVESQARAIATAVASRASR